MTEES
jgi:hypothetical protein